MAPMIKRVGIVGSGIMGSGIAEVAAKAGFEVVLRSRRQETADAMVGALEKSLAKQLEKGRIDEATRERGRRELIEAMTRPEGLWNQRM